MNKSANFEDIYNDFFGQKEVKDNMNMKINW